MASAKNASRFAALSKFLEDSDSDDEGFATVGGGGGQKKGSAATAKNRKKQQVNAANFGPYIVAPQNPGDKKKKRKAKKSQSEAADTDEWKDADDEEQNEIQKAILISRQEFEDGHHQRVVVEEEGYFEMAQKAKKIADENRSPTVKKNAKAKPSTGVGADQQNGAAAGEPATHSDFNAADALMSDVDAEAKRLLDKKSGSDLEKAKSRSKKLLQVLTDAETKEKAEIIVENEKVKKVNSELTDQVEMTTGELQQAKSRVHDLEIELRKVTESRAKHAAVH